MEQTRERVVVAKHLPYTFSIDQGGSTNKCKFGKRISDVKAPYETAIPKSDIAAKESNPKFRRYSGIIGDLKSEGNHFLSKISKEPLADRCLDQNLKQQSDKVQKNKVKPPNLTVETSSRTQARTGLSTPKASGLTVQHFLVSGPASTRNASGKTQLFKSLTEEVPIPLQCKLETSVPNLEHTKCSVKKNGEISAYAAHTNMGIVRNYNEDRVAIILNIIKPLSREKETWPKCSFFGVYDGHGGSKCADFLRDNLHQYVIKEPSFPSNPREALIRGFAKAENALLEQATKAKIQGGMVERSGSCAICLLIVGNTCYIANVGDSRGILSADYGSKVYILTKDHKPSEEFEQRRIRDHGGQVYQSTFQNPQSSTNEAVIGPMRVFPGRLSVSRTFGDPEAKLEIFGGKSGVIVATPDIRSFEIGPNLDYIVLGSDGIFDKLSNKDIVQCALNTLKEPLLAKSVHHECGLAVECIIRNALLRKSFDNVTVLMVAFKNFKEAYKHCIQLKESRTPETKMQPIVNKLGSLLEPRSGNNRNKGTLKQKAFTKDQIQKDIIYRSLPHSKAK